MTALTVGELRRILTDETIDDHLPVVLVHHNGTRFVAESASGTAIIERDEKSHAPATGRVSETTPELLRGPRVGCFAIYDR